MATAVPTPLLTEDGVDIAGHRWPTAAARAAVVVVHGFTGHKSDINVVAVSTALHESGFDVLTFDSRGHGESGGLCTLGDLERHDVAAAVAAIRERDRPVVVVGASMGAIAALRYAVDDPTLAGVVTVSSPATWQVPRNPRAALAALLTQTGAGRAVSARWLGARLQPAWTAAEPPIELVPRLRVPLAVVHGQRDRFVRPLSARLLHAAANEPRRLELVTAMGHAFSPAAVDAVLRSVEWVLTQRAAVEQPYPS